MLLWAQITLKSTREVTLAITVQTNQSGRSLTVEYPIPSTNGEKRKQFVPHLALKGVLFKYVLTSDEPFFLYREETQVQIQPWGSTAPIVAQPFGNDDLTVPTRSMIAADLAAARPGGGSQ